MELSKAQISTEIHWVPGHSGVERNVKAGAKIEAVVASRAREGNLPRQACILWESFKVLFFTALKRQVTNRPQRLAEDW